MHDMIEMYEAAIERWADTHVRGDQFLCSCGKWCSLGEGVPLSANPYAPPFCPTCAGLTPAVSD